MKNVVEEVIPEASTSKSELSLLNKKFEEFKRTRDIDVLLSNKSDGDIVVDLNKNVPLTTSRSIGRLPSRPSF
ncbi:hypothetical protein NQ314_003017 [Rhamnusium bicolor]|uniref:Uncharacterized protein n=1 Tax=Rhamnusium bicolor TaxID=1586634 RepID=A0AAV8ZMQ8_9CUCU|nr:hypothetical protein NQ314_003017 [Rhamnusium bicolor]